MPVDPGRERVTLIPAARHFASGKHIDGTRRGQRTPHAPALSLERERQLDAPAQRSIRRNGDPIRRDFRKYFDGAHDVLEACPHVRLPFVEYFRPQLGAAAEPVFDPGDQVLGTLRARERGHAVGKCELVHVAYLVKPPPMQAQAGARLQPPAQSEARVPGGLTGRPSTRKRCTRSPTSGTQRSRISSAARRTRQRVSRRAPGAASATAARVAKTAPREARQTWPRCHSGIRRGHA